MMMSRAMGSEALTAAAKSGPAPPGNTKQNPRSMARCSSAKLCWSNPTATFHGDAGVVRAVAGRASPHATLIPSLGKFATGVSR